MKKIVSLILALVMVAGIAASFPVIADGEGLPFRDVKTDDWFYPYVKYAYDNSLMQGKSDAVFGPEDKVTRAEIVTVFYRMAGRWCEYPEQYLRFADVKRSSTEWYAPYVGWAKYEELIDGYNRKFMNPYVAAGHGYVDEVILPEETRSRIVAALRMLGNKKQAIPAKKHGNIPL